MRTALETVSLGTSSGEHRPPNHMLSQSPKRERDLTPNSDFSESSISAVIVAALGADASPANANSDPLVGASAAPYRPSKQRPPRWRSTGTCRVARSQQAVGCDMPSPLPARFFPLSDLRVR